MEILNRIPVIGCMTVSGAISYQEKPHVPDLIHYRLFFLAAHQRFVKGLSSNESLLPFFSIMLYQNSNNYTPQVSRICNWIPGSLTNHTGGRKPKALQCQGLQLSKQTDGQTNRRPGIYRTIFHHVLQFLDAYFD